MSKRKYVLGVTAVPAEDAKAVLVCRIVKNDDKVSYLAKRVYGYTAALSTRWSKAASVRYTGVMYFDYLKPIEDQPGYEGIIEEMVEHWKERTKAEKKESEAQESAEYLLSNYKDHFLVDADAYRELFIVASHCIDSVEHPITVGVLLGRLGMLFAKMNTPTLAEALEGKTNEH